VPEFGPLGRLVGLSAAFHGGHRPRARRGAAPGRRRGLGAAAPAPLKAAAQKSENEWTFVCDGTVLDRADPGYVGHRPGGVASRDPLQNEDEY
jgi:hypothetical protein